MSTDEFLHMIVVGKTQTKIYIFKKKFIKILHDEVSISKSVRSEKMKQNLYVMPTFAAEKILYEKNPL